METTSNDMKQINATTAIIILFCVGMFSGCASASPKAVLEPVDGVVIEAEKMSAAMHNEHARAYLSEGQSALQRARDTETGIMTVGADEALQELDHLAYISEQNASTARMMSSQSAALAEVARHETQLADQGQVWFEARPPANVEQREDSDPLLLARATALDDVTQGGSAMDLPSPLLCAAPNRSTLQTSCESRTYGLCQLCAIRPNAFRGTGASRKGFSGWERFVSFADC